MIHTAEPGLNSTGQMAPQVKTLVKAEVLEGVAVDVEDNGLSGSKLTIINYNEFC
jgi:hypothetical protein